ncbi:MAG: hypothetical protein U0401_28855 [Anaerolineae bacterium]
MATIALGAASCSHGVEDLPDHLFHNLERGKYGYDYLRELDRKLLQRVKV